MSWFYAWPNFLIWLLTYYNTVPITPHAGIWGAWHASCVTAVHPVTNYDGVVKIRMLCWYGALLHSKRVPGDSILCYCLMESYEWFKATTRGPLRWLIHSHYLSIIRVTVHVRVLTWLVSLIIDSSCDCVKTSEWTPGGGLKWHSDICNSWKRE